MSKITTNSKAQNIALAVKKHIIDGMDLAAYDITPKFDNVSYEGDLKADCNTVFNCFIDETGVSRGLTHALSSSVAEWLQGLPSILNIHFTYFDIIKFGISCGAIKQSYPTQKGRETAENAFCDSWFNRVAIQFLQMVEAKNESKATISLLDYCKNNK